MAFVQTGVMNRGKIMNALTCIIVLKHAAVVLLCDVADDASFVSMPVTSMPRMPALPSKGNSERGTDLCFAFFFFVFHSC